MNAIQEIRRAQKKNKKLLLGKIPKSLIALRKTATNQSINRSINQSINHSCYRILLLSPHKNTTETGSNQ